MATNQFDSSGNFSVTNPNMVKGFVPFCVESCTRLVLDLWSSLRPLDRIPDTDSIILFLNFSNALAVLGRNASDLKKMLSFPNAFPQPTSHDDIGPTLSHIICALNFPSAELQCDGSTSSLVRLLGISDPSYVSSTVDISSTRIETATSPKKKRSTKKVKNQPSSSHPGSQSSAEGSTGIQDTEAIENLREHAFELIQSAVERHHLFPKAYLNKIGFTEIRDNNQIADFALVEWNDNIAISYEAPDSYYPKYASQVFQKTN